MKKKEMRKVIRNQRRLIAEIYQVLGCLDAPAKVLDQVSAAAVGQKLPSKTLLPFVTVLKEHRDR